jgi:hypothetical protein
MHLDVCCKHAIEGHWQLHHPLTSYWFFAVTGLSQVQNHLVSTPLLSVLCGDRFLCVCAVWLGQSTSSSDVMALHSVAELEG